jgi:hypothetical protein
MLDALPHALAPSEGNSAKFGGIKASRLIHSQTVSAKKPC